MAVTSAIKYVCERVKQICYTTSCESVFLCVHRVVRPVRTPSNLGLSVCRTESTTGTPNPSASSAPAAPSALWASASWACRACCCAPWSARRRSWPPEGTSRIIFEKVLRAPQATFSLMQYISFLPSYYFNK